MSTAIDLHRESPSAMVPGGAQGAYALVLDAAERIAPLLPKGVDIKYVAAAVYQACSRDENLRRCDGESIVQAVCKIAQWGLDIGTTAHIVPFGRVATPVADYKGIAQLMIASGFVRAIETRVVREGDRFEYALGLEPLLQHQPKAKSTAPITHAYVVLVMRGGIRTFHVMDADEIDAIRQKHSKQWKNGPLTSWYANKTVLRQAAKLIPNPRLAAALRVVEADEAAEFGAVEVGGTLSLGAGRVEEDDVPVAPTAVRPALVVEEAPATNEQLVLLNQYCRDERLSAKAREKMLDVMSTEDVSEERADRWIAQCRAALAKVEAATEVAPAAADAAAAEPYVPSQHQAKVEPATTGAPKTGRRSTGYDPAVIRGQITTVLKSGRIPEREAATFFALLESTDQTQAALGQLFEQVRAAANRDVAAAVPVDDSPLPF